MEMDVDALRGAVKANDIQRVRALVQSGLDVNAAGAGGWTALHLAAYSGFVECVQVCCCIRGDVPVMRC